MFLSCCRRDAAVRYDLVNGKERSAGGLTYATDSSMSISTSLDAYLCTRAAAFMLTGRWKLFAILSAVQFVTLPRFIHRPWTRPDYACVADADIIFLPCGIFLLFSSPNLTGRRLDVYHTSTHGVALGRI